MELQIIHESIEGDFKKTAILSILYEQEPGAENDGFVSLDILNIPIAGASEVGNFYDKFTKFNVWKFMYKQERFEK